MIVLSFVATKLEIRFFSSLFFRLCFSLPLFFSSSSPPPFFYLSLLLLHFSPLLVFPLSFLGYGSFCFLHSSLSPRVHPFFSLSLSLLLLPSHTFAQPVPFFFSTQFFPLETNPPRPVSLPNSLPKQPVAYGLGL
ncbi:hypothetical protein BDY24DRAFT_205537 [Mrakia frigida]|uniref:uncharacterized protein n=1 Tax=Mrakia frigida TaxID=29902 RepID=UPI003FCC218F